MLTENRVVAFENSYKKNMALKCPRDAIRVCHNGKRKNFVPERIGINDKLLNPPVKDMLAMAQRLPKGRCKCACAIPQVSIEPDTQMCACA